MLILVLGGCMSWQQPAPVDEAGYRERSVATAIEDPRLSGPVHVRATVLDPADSEALLGADVSEHGIEPVWIEVTNGSDQQLIFLHSGADPDYFSPLEVSWLLHGSVFGGGDAAVDRYVQSVSFPRGVIAPGAVSSGVIFTNPSPGVKLVNADFLGDGVFVSATLFPPVPTATSAVAALPELDAAGDAVRDYVEEAAFREALEQFYREAVDQPGLTLPPTTVIVGRGEDIAAAAARRGYRQRRPGAAPEQLFGRPPEYRLRKWSQAGSPGNWVNTWQLPISFRGLPVLLAQTGAPRGGRFVNITAGSVPDPAIDYIRNLLVEDFLFSENLAGLAAFTPGYRSERFAGKTDGRLVVLFVTGRSSGPDEAWMADWDCLQDACELPAARAVDD